jgi:hypothetical protein
MWTLVAIAAENTDESKQLMDGSRALRMGGCRERQVDNERYH